MASSQAPQPISAAATAAAASDQPAIPDTAAETDSPTNKGGNIPPAHLAIIAAAAAVQREEIPRKHLAIIAAAAHMVLGTSTILRIDQIGRRSAWVAGGRLTHQTSHNTTRRRR